MTQLNSYDCENCNPTVLNPEFMTKCQWCEKYHAKKQIVFHKGTSVGTTESMCRLHDGDYVITT